MPKKKIKPKEDKHYIILNQDDEAIVLYDLEDVRMYLEDLFGENVSYIDKNDARVFEIKKQINYDIFFPEPEITFEE